MYNSYTEAPLTFSTFGTADPAKRRDAKIEGFRREKEMKRTLEVRFCSIYACVYLHVYIQDISLDVLC